jgi:tRNA threonylcarbamoyladenosine biosynthesis protein TsaE
MPEEREILDRVVETHSPEETFRLGVMLGQSLLIAHNILLYGDLGMGKTVLAKGIICGLGAENPDDIVSPSFTLIQEYRVKHQIVQHVDLYRLDNARDIEGLGLKESLQDENIFVIVEWAEKLPYPVLKKTISIRIHDLGDDQRTLRVECS